MSYQSDAHKKETIYKFQSTECDLSVSPDVQYLYGAKNVLILLCQKKVYHIIITKDQFVAGFVTVSKKLMS